MAASAGGAMSMVKNITLGTSVQRLSWALTECGAISGVDYIWDEVTVLSHPSYEYSTRRFLSHYRGCAWIPLATSFISQSRTVWFYCCTFYLPKILAQPDVGLVKKKNEQFSCHLSNNIKTVFDGLTKRDKEWKYKGRCMVRLRAKVWTHSLQNVKEECAVSGFWSGVAKASFFW